MIRLRYWATPYIIFLVTCCGLISSGIIPIYYTFPVLAVPVLWFITTRKMIDRGWIRK
jgi:hypothetical protein